MSPSSETRALAAQWDRLERFVYLVLLAALTASMMIAVKVTLSSPTSIGPQPDFDDGPEQLLVAELPRTGDALAVPTPRRGTSSEYEVETVVHHPAEVRGRDIQPPWTEVRVKPKVRT